MTATRIARWLTMGAFVVGGLVAGCTYAPDIRSGALKCSPDRQCPRGYMCSTALTCCLPDDLACGSTVPPTDASVTSDGSLHFEVRPDALGTGGHPADGTGGTTAPGSGGAGGTTTVSDDMTAYVGTWGFTSASTLDTECEDGTGSGGPQPFLTQKSPTSTITITNNGDGTLTAAWSEWSACTYTLSVDSTGAHGIDADSWACEYTYNPTATNPPQLSDQLWVYDSFDIVTANTQTATHDGVYVRQDSYNDGSFVYCTQTLHAPMTKQ